MADDKLKNFIPISRKIFSHELWEEKREFSKFEAWIDLLQTARFDSDERIEWINNKPVKFGRGQLIGSVRFLQKRWNWGSTSRVDRYLNALKKQNMVDLKTEQGVSVITICKYDDYNKKELSHETLTRQGAEQQRDKTNTVNKVNNITNVGLPLENLKLELDVEVKKSTKVERCERFIKYFNSEKEKATGKIGVFRINDKLVNKFNSLIKVYDSKDIALAVNKAFRDDFHKSNNFKYLTPKYILDSDKLDMFINATEQLKQETNLFQLP